MSANKMPAALDRSPAPVSANKMPAAPERSLTKEDSSAESMRFLATASSVARLWQKHATPKPRSEEGHASVFYITIAKTRAARQAQGGSGSAAKVQPQVAEHMHLTHGKRQ